ncbi:hypothetical protein C453_00625 [Haloferax elongans ATCC BAA-1513]|uniref:Uncharacterized protein n=1 Tax=Haloferax elongans ATCC BAA-1513 TaxID=1230453 RepID=M0HY78_HALEO|nr:hypothetical protein [Haloferax elongans]ELZ89535.1 hypothetical protein C453_00625 [Haloferax elongans ATCC BAA-1513]
MKVSEHSDTGRTVELRITDHEDTAHHLTLSADGMVEDHWHDQSLPDGQSRSLGDEERLARVERFAKYYLTRTTDADVLSPYSSTDQIADPDRLAVATLLVGAMSQETLASHLQPCYDQLTAHRRNDNPPVAPPQATRDTPWQLVEQDVHLTLDSEEIRQLSDVLTEMNALGEIRHALDVRPDRDDSDLFARLTRLLSTAGTTSAGDASSEQFLRVSAPLRVHWNTDDGPTCVEYGDSTASDGDATLAARIQLTPAHTPIISMAAFQRTLVDHLRCQIRDCYVGMGLRPPADTQVTGHGIAACTDRYDRADQLQNYHNEHAILDWAGLAPRPEF